MQQEEGTDRLLRLGDQGLKDSKYALLLDTEDEYQRTKEERDFANMKYSLWKRIIQLLKLFAPVAISQLMDVLIELINLTYAGRLGQTKYLAGMGFSITAINVLCQSILNGLSYGINTLGSHAYGAGNYKLYSSYCHRAFFILLIAWVLLLPFFLFIGTFLIFIGVNEDVADLVGIYARIVYLGMLFYAEGLLIRRFYQSQRLMVAQFLPSALCVPVHLLLCEVYTNLFDFGFSGIALALTTTYIIKAGIFCSFLLKSCKCVHSRETIQPFSWEDFKGWGEYLQVAIPAMLLQLIEWWSFELSTIVCAFISVEMLAAQSVMMNYVLMMYMVSLASSNSLATLVGNAIGMNEPRLARLFARDGILLALSISLLLVALSAIFRDYLLSFFTDDSKVIDMLDSIFYLGLVGIWLDVIQNSQNGILRGLGNLVWPSLTALLVFYVFFQPVSLSLLFNTDLGLLSIWIVLPFTPILNAIAQFIMIRRVNFETLAFRKNHELRHHHPEEEIPAHNISVVTFPAERTSQTVNHRIN